MHAIDHALSQPPPIHSRWETLFPPGLLNELHAHPLLDRCRTGRSSLQLLRDLLVQHHHYSRNFARYLCTLMGALNESRDVRALAGNLIEEAGLDRPGNVTHSELFQRSLTEIGARPDSVGPLPQTRALIDAMFGYCRSHDPLDGLAALCLGAEAIVPTLYGSIMQGLRHVGMSKTGLHFFELHVEEDEGHALVMRDIIDRLLAERSYLRGKVLAIGEHMVRLRMEMLDAVLAQHPELSHER